MQLFHEYLRELIEKNHLTISLLARRAGIERTTLSRVLSGQRTLPYNKLDSIISHLGLTVEEEKTLRYYYEKQFEKKGIQESRRIIDKMFSELFNLDFLVPAFEERRILVDVEQYVRNKTVFSGDINVQSLLRVVLSEELFRGEDARIEMTIPPQYRFLNNELLQRYMTEGIDAEVTQIIMFHSVEEDYEINLQNLKHFCQILPYCLLSCQKYHPYYYYNSRGRHQYTDPFPYFLVTHNCVICLSENGDEAMLLRNNDQVAYYHKYFQQILMRCHSLVHYTVDPLEMLNVYSKCTDQEGFYMIMDQPCFGRFYTDEFIEKHIYDELPDRERLVSAAKERFQVLRTGKDFYTLFTRDGLRRFQETGILDDFPTALVRPFEPAVRKKLMLELADKIASGEIVARVLESELFPSYLSVTTSVYSGIGFFVTQDLPMKKGYFTIQLKEPALCHAFHEWLLSLENGRNTLGIEKTLRIIRKMAEEIQ